MFLFLGGESAADCQKHIKAGAKRVIMCAPAK